MIGLRQHLACSSVQWEDVIVRMVGSLCVEVVVCSVLTVLPASTGS